MRMYRLFVSDTVSKEVVFQCVVSSEDLNMSVSYWLDHGNYTVSISKF